MKSERPFSESFIKELHALITRSQDRAAGVDMFGRRTEVPLLRGEYKRYPNNPTRRDGTVHEYCPPEQVATQMERPVEMHNRYRAVNVPPEVFAVWLHHRFTQIHPFQDGNGRVARALASLVFIRQGWFPLVVHRDQRSVYIDALEAADGGNLALLVEMFAAAQRKAFVNALGIAREVARERERLDEMVVAIGDQFRRRDESLAANMVQAKDHADALWRESGSRFTETAAQLQGAIRGLRDDRHVFDDYGAPDDQTYRRRWHRWQIVEAARDLGYYANLAEWAAWWRIVLETESGRSEILLSFHAMGWEYRGVIGVSVSFYRRPETDEGRSMIDDRTTVSRELFQINYLESLEALRARFHAWLEKYLLQALELWRRGE